MNQLLDRVLPHDPAAESAVLGALLADPKGASALVLDSLTQDDFYSAAHQVICREALAMLDTLAALDLVTFSSRMADKKLLEEIGGDAYLAGLVMKHVSIVSLPQHVKIVREKSVLRRLINLCTEMAARAFEENATDLLPAFQQAVLDLDRVTTGGDLDSATAVRAAMKDFEAWSAGNRAGGGLATGFRDLDTLTNGMQPGQMIVIAGRPSMGKSALAMNIVENVAVAGSPVGVFTLEMTGRELMHRMITSLARVNLKAIRAGFGSTRDWLPITSAAGKLMRTRFWLDERPALTVQQIRAKARRWKMEHGIGLAVVDYIGLVRSPSQRGNMSRQVEVSDVSAGLKAMAKELEIPVLVLAQLNRQVEGRDGVPRLSDLRESGSIEQDADVVGLLHRPEVYERDEEEAVKLRGQAVLNIAKQRNGPTGDIELVFTAEHVRFADAARVDRDDIDAQAALPYKED